MAITTDQVTEVADADRGIDGEESEESTSAEPSTPVPERTTHPKLAAAVLILSALLIGVAISATHFNLDVHENRAATERDHAVLDTGRRVAAELVTLDHNSAQRDLDSIAANSTGSFRDQFSKVSGTFASVLSQGRVESTGEVKEVGISSADDHHATVLAAVTSTVKNTEAPDGQLRVYRMKMSLDKIDSKWLVSNVEFVA
ncbi:hypothetical protein [Nocardia sp. NPDC059228]|uniref:hypothetical protein n=1 Tax=Nocardia sp. NPDC059228 TaxID=3346777 RepID=UPI00369F9F95